jgi:ATP-binding cassette subfamily F protein 3
MAAMLVQPANLLILDEPTNHLDIPAKETLEAALRQYDGTILMVSHDRYFISQVATKIVEIRDGELRLYRGDYHYYLEKLEAEKEEARRQAAEAERAAKQAAKRRKQKEKQKEKAAARKAAKA